MYTLNTPQLKRGDIILTTSKNKVSSIVRILTLGSFSHAMIYLGGDSCADAAGPGARVAAHNTQRIFFESHKQCVVLRLKNELGQAQMNTVIDQARRLIGTEYSLPEAKLTILRARFSAKDVNRQFCSRYVAQCYETVSIILAPNPDYCSPEDLNSSNELVRVSNHLRQASKEEVDFFSKESIPLSARDYADNYIFTNAAILSGMDIQTHEQFNAALLIKPDLDDAFSEVLEESGYLNLWEIEKDENPWFYDFAVFMEHFPDATYRRTICNRRLPEEWEIRRGLQLTKDTLSRAIHTNRLQTFQLQIDLCDTLLELSRIREMIWTLGQIA